MNVFYLVLAGLIGAVFAVAVLLVLRSRRSYFDSFETDETSPTKTAANVEQAVAEEGSQEASLPWADVEMHLPPEWRALDRVPADAVGRLEPVSAPFAESIIRGAMNAMPSLAMNVNSSRLFRMVGPPEVFSGLEAGNLSFMVDKSGGQMMDLVDHTHQIRHKARVVPAGGGTKAAAVAAGTFQILSVATAQFYLHQITEQLGNISKKLDDVLGKLDDRRFGKVLGAAETIDEVYNGVLRDLKTEGIEQLNASQEFWTRMANAEQALREAIAECERDYSRHRSEWLEGLGERCDEGWRRRKTTKRNDLGIYEEIARWMSSLGEIHTAASFAMFRWYQVALAHDAFTTSSRLKPRYEKLMEYMEKRMDFWRTQFTDSEVFLAFKGEHGWDTTKDLLSYAAAITVVPAIIAENTDKKHIEGYNQLDEIYTDWLTGLVPMAEMEDQQNQAFFIEAEPNRQTTSYRLLRVAQEQ